MPARPRTWPSTRFSRFRTEALISLRMHLIYPHRVYGSRCRRFLMAMTDHKHMVDPAGRGDHVHATDPVCGMSVDPQTAKHRFAYKGQDYFFCSGRCRERFEAEPGKFLASKAPEPAAPAGAIYTCPMHPEVKQAGPGS